MEDTQTSAFNRLTIATCMIHICYGLVFPVLPLRPQEILGDESAGAYWHGLTMAINGLSGMITAPVLGTLSDKHGRKIFLIALFLSSSIEFMLGGMINDIQIFLVGRIIGGMACTHWTLLTAATMDKSVNLAFLTGMGLGIGFIIGPVLGGLLGDLMPEAPFIAAACLAVFAAIFSLFFLPETAPGAKGSISGEAGELMDNGINPLKAISILFSTPIMRRLSLAFLFGALGFEGFASAVILYLNFKFKWTKQELGSHMGMMGLSFFVAQTMLLPLLKRMRMSDYGIALFSCVWGVLVGLIYACGTSSVIFWSALIIGPCGIQGVVITSIMSNHLEASDQGKLGGCIVVMDRAGRIFGALVLTSLFAYLTAVERTEPFPEVIPFIVGVLSFMSFAFLQNVPSNEGETKQT